MGRSQLVRQREIQSRNDDDHHFDHDSEDDHHFVHDFDHHHHHDFDNDDHDVNHHDPDPDDHVDEQISKTTLGGNGI